MEQSVVSAQSEMSMGLKVCERCGALWLRAIGSDGKHCKRCTAAMVERECVVRARVGRPYAERRDRVVRAGREWSAGSSGLRRGVGVVSVGGGR